MRVGIIFVGATPNQNKFWWPSYEMCDPGYKHDMIFVHRNMDGVPEKVPFKGEDLIFENKIFRYFELEHKAFGAYRHYFMKYSKDYDIFAFISDDVYLRRDNWLKDVVDMFEKYPKLGIISPMLHNHPPHARAPIWFGRKEALIQMDWGFQNDHHGETTIADRCVNANYFVAQIGHKIDFAYDPYWDGYANPRVCGSPQPNQWLEKIWFGEDHFDRKFTTEEIQSLDRYLEKMIAQNVFDEEISDLRISSRLQFQRWNPCIEIQPYHGLIYNRSLEIVRECGLEYHVYEGPIHVGEVNPSTRTFFGPNNGIYLSQGINSKNPIAVLK